MSTWELKGSYNGELTVVVEGEKWADAQKKSFEKIRKELQVPGFRKGKLPASMAKKYIQEQEVLFNAVDTVANDALVEGVEANNLVLVDRPTVDVKAISTEKVELVFACTVEPEVTLGEYKGLEYNVETVTVTEDEVNAEITKLQEKYAELVEKETAENGDTVTFDFEGFVDGVAFEGGKGDNYPLVLGSNSFVPGFEDQLVGTKAGESKDVVVTFPVDYTEDLAGKEATFKCTIHKVEGKELPELDDDFAADLNMPEVETVDQLKAHLNTTLTNEKAAKAEETALNSLVEKVLENATVDIPAVMINDEVEYQLRNQEAQFQSQGISLEMFYQITGSTEEQLKEQLRPNAENAVKARLVLNAIVKAENLEVTEEEIEAEYATVASQYSMDVEEVKKYIDVNIVSENIARNKAIDFVKESAK